MDLILLVVSVELAIGIIALLFIPTIILRSASGLTDKEEVELSNEIRKMLASVFGAILVVSAALGGWKEYQFKAYQDYGKQANAAFQLLNSKSSGARIGGIFGLSRVIEDSDRDKNLLLRSMHASINQWAAKTTRSRNSPLLGEATAAVQEFGRLQNDYIKDCGHLIFTDLNLMNLEAANLNLSKCKFRSVDFSGASLPKSKFKNAMFIAVDFKGANLAGANFDNANISGGTFKSTDVRGAIFSNTKGLNPAAFEDALMDKHSVFPDYIDEEIRSKRRGVQK